MSCDRIGFGHATASPECGSDANSNILATLSPATGSTIERGGSISAPYTSTDPLDPASVRVTIGGGTAATPVLTPTAITATIPATVPLGVHLVVVTAKTTTGRACALVAGTYKVIDAPPPPPVDVSVAQQANATDVQVGDPVTFTVTATNGSSGTAHAVTLIDTPPPGAVITPACDAPAADNTVSCHPGDLAPTGSATYTVQATAAAVGQLCNAANVLEQETDSNPADNQVSTCVTVHEAPPPPAQVDLQITGTGAPEPATVKSNVTYKLTVTNAGPDTANNTVVSATMPLGLYTLWGKSKAGACTYTTSTRVLSCPLGAVATTAPVITVRARSTKAGTFTPTFSVAADETDLTPANNTVSITTTANPVAPSGDTDVSVVETATPNPVVVGATLTYTAYVTNGGDNPANGVVLTDTLPANVTVGSVTPDVGTCSTSTTVVTCQLGTIAVGATVKVVITVSPTATGKITSKVAVSSTNTDVNAGNNSSSVATTVKAS
jgi:uncharacterized repeat protein (TIGR01451 family)